MAQFTLDQVPGWDLLERAAALVNVPLVLASPDAAAPPGPAGSYRWGDADALRAAADQWSRSGAAVAELAAPDGTLHAGAQAVSTAWTGTAAEAYLRYEGTLETGFDTVASALRQVGTRLYDLADALDQTAQAQVARVLWAVATVTSALTTLTSNGSSAPLVAGALTDLVNRLGDDARRHHALGVAAGDALRSLLVAGNGLEQGSGGPQLPAP